MQKKKKIRKGANTFSHHCISAELNVDYWPKNPYFVEACIGFFHVAFSVSLRALDDLNKILIMSKFTTPNQKKLGQYGKRK